MDSSAKEKKSKTVSVTENFKFGGPRNMALLVKETKSGVYYMFWNSEYATVILSNIRPLKSSTYQRQNTSPDTGWRIYIADPYPCNVKKRDDFKKIGSRVGRNQTTVMRICHHWMQEGTMDQRGRSHPPQCTTSREDRQIVRRAVTDHSVTSRPTSQHIESVTHHSVSARTIRRRLQQSGLSARRPMLVLPLT
ncbi:transposable element Tcb1 transposase [Trichonephila clavipes]|nr:transposable element Tcb1 transposase [Trichonephila clavipes]